MILLNPYNGAPIKDLFYKGVKYFSEDKKEVFKVDSIVKIDDEVGRFVIGIYDFLQELTREQAIKFVEEQKKTKFTCADCGVKFGAEKTYLEHKQTHEIEAKLDDELGIPVIKGEGTVKEDEKDNQKAIDYQLESEGITGEGLREEVSRPAARF